MKILERALKILDRGVKFHRASLGVHGALQNSQDASVFRDFASGKFSKILERARKSLENVFAQKKKSAKIGRWGFLIVKNNPIRKKSESCRIIVDV